jgi:NAD(P)-dependent dehydrogenase (short-subunit alcohol dehydrogenase family)
MDEFAGKVGVITGGASGIGLALARRFGREGMKLVIADIQQDALDAAARDLEGDGIEILAVQADVSDRAQVQSVADATMERYGALHLACNNAGVGSGGLSWELTENDWAWTLGVDLWGVIHGVGIFTPLIIRSGGGHVVNTASMAGLSSPPYMAPYNVAKHGVVALSESMFLELEMVEPSVGVTVVCPGWVQTGIHLSDRNRPTTGAQASTTTVTAGDAENLRSFIGQLIAGGITPESVADMVFDAVRDRRFYVLTHPDWSAGVLRNTERMLAGENPQMNIPT